MISKPFSTSSIFTLQKFNLNFQTHIPFYVYFTFLFILSVSGAYAKEDQENARLSAAQKYIEQNKPSEAVKEYRKYLSSHPEDAQAVALLGQAYEKLGNNDKAKSTYEKALKMKPGLKLAKQRLEKLTSKSADSEKSDKKEVKDDKKSESKKESKDAHAEKKKTANSETKESKNNPNIDKAIKLQKDKKFKEAAEVWDKVLAEDAQNPKALYNAAAVHLAIHNDSKAYQYYKAYIEHSKDEKLVKKAKQRLEELAKKNPELAKQSPKEEPKKEEKANPKSEKEAKKDEHGAVEAKHDEHKKEGKEASKSEKSAEPTIEDEENKAPNPQYIESVKAGFPFVIHTKKGPGADELRMAQRLLNNGKVNEAIDKMKEVTLKYPNSLNALAAKFDLLQSYTDLGLDPSIKNVAEAALMSNPPEPYASAYRFLLAKAYLNQKDMVSAQKQIDLIKEGGVLGPNKSRKLEIQSLLSQQSQGGQKGEAALLESIQLAPTKAEKIKLYQDLIDFYKRNVKVAEREKAWASLIQICPENDTNSIKICRTAIYAYAGQLFKKGALDAAKNLYQKGINQYNDKVDAPFGWYQLGNIYRKQKLFTEAIQAYNTVSEKFPGTYWAQQAIWQKEDTIWHNQYKEILNRE